MIDFLCGWTWLIAKGAAMAETTRGSPFTAGRHQYRASDAEGLLHQTKNHINPC